MFDGLIVVVLDILGVIHETPRSTVSQQEENELLEAMALSLSMVPNHVADPTPRPIVPKARPPLMPPLPPPDSPPSPPADRPTGAQRAAYRAMAHLPELAPPIGHRLRLWPQKKEGLWFFPSSNRSYGPHRRVRPHRVTSSASNYRPSDSDESEDDDRSDATSTVSTTVSHHHLPHGRPPTPWITVLINRRKSWVCFNLSCARGVVIHVKLFWAKSR